MYKLDLTHAYRQISICPSSLYLDVFFLEGSYIFDTVLSMGLRSMAHICQWVTNAFAFMILNLGFR
jgi:hypothetical protein